MTHADWYFLITLVFFVVLTLIDLYGGHDIAPEVPIYIFAAILWPFYLPFLVVGLVAWKFNLGIYRRHA